jgi:thiamine biosynthesis lipoprotein
LRGAHARHGRLFGVRYDHVLGTELELSLRAPSDEIAKRAERAVLAEIDRLEPIYSRFDPDSELNRWLAGDDERISEDLAWLLEQSQAWITRTRGAFQPGTDALTALWKAAESAGEPPATEDIARVVARFGAPLYELDTVARRARKRFPHGLSFNAIAKGRIVDLAALAAADAGATEVLLTIGGEIRHLGAEHPRVAVADPRHAEDNAPMTTAVRLHGDAIASSGGSYRGFEIGGRWYSHVLDPRSGRPVAHTVAATVLAPDCSTADVLATAFSVLPAHESLALADGLPGVACRLVAADGAVATNAAFEDRMAR